MAAVAVVVAAVAVDLQSEDALAPAQSIRKVGSSTVPRL
jgi:hypothetical protein